MKLTENYKKNLKNLAGLNIITEHSEEVIYKVHRLAHAMGSADLALDALVEVLGPAIINAAIDKIVMQNDIQFQDAPISKFSKPSDEYHEKNIEQNTLDTLTKRRNDPINLNETSVK